MSRWQARLAAALALAFTAGATVAAYPPPAARAASDFPTIPVRALVGAFKDSSNTLRGSVLCLGALGPRPGLDSLAVQPRTISLRFRRDPAVESRPDFGGYRIYRMINNPDPTRAVLLRRFSVNPGSEISWNFSRVDSATQRFICKGAEVHDEVVTFVDPDSSGNWVKVCKTPLPSGACASPGDSVYKLIAPPGPHDGFRTYYSITYEGKDGTDPAYADLFVPDSSNGSFTLCDTTGLGQIRAGLDPTGALYQQMLRTCPNLNGKLNNLVGPIEPSGGPVANLERVGVVPNPYRATAQWDLAGQNEIHFINLPRQSTIKIFTVSGDLVRQLVHSDPVYDFESWDLNSGAGKTVASGIYIYRVTAGSYSYQDRFIVIR